VLGPCSRKRPKEKWSYVEEKGPYVEGKGPNVEGQEPLSPNTTDILSLSLSVEWALVLEKGPLFLEEKGPFH